MRDLKEKPNQPKVKSHVFMERGKSIRRAVTGRMGKLMKDRYRREQVKGRQEQEPSAAVSAEEQVEQYECPDKVKFQLAVAVEEIFVNIAHYAYHPEVGEACVRCEAGGEPFQVIVGFADQGRPYNPLEREDPDVTLDAEQRQIRESPESLPIF